MDTNITKQSSKRIDHYIMAFDVLDHYIMVFDVLDRVMKDKLHMSGCNNCHPSRVGRARSRKEQVFGIWNWVLLRVLYVSLL